MKRYIVWKPKKNRPYDMSRADKFFIPSAVLSRAVRIAGGAEGVPGLNVVVYPGEDSMSVSLDAIGGTPSGDDDVTRALVRVFEAAKTLDFNEVPFMKIDRRRQFRLTGAWCGKNEYLQRFTARLVFLSGGMRKPTKKASPEYVDSYDEYLTKFSRQAIKRGALYDAIIAACARDDNDPDEMRKNKLETYFKYEKHKTFDTALRDINGGGGGLPAGGGDKGGDDARGGLRAGDAAGDGGDGFVPEGNKAAVRRAADGRTYNPVKWLWRKWEAMIWG